MNSTKLLLTILLILTYGSLLSCGDQSLDDHDHEDEPHFADSGDGEQESAHSDHDNEMVVELSEEEIRNARISTFVVEYGSVPESRRLYGEIGLNEERVIHKYPKYPGVLRDVRVNIGDHVRTGDTLAIVFNTSTLSLYSVVAAQSGEVLEKHAVVGEYLDGSEPIMVVGDLSSVWVDLNAFEKDMALIRRGQTLTLHPIEGPETIQTTIRYIKPVMEAVTRTNTVRCVVDNRDGEWNPGRLVYAEVFTNTGDESVLIVPEQAIQTVESQKVVFIPMHEGEFEVVPIQTGRRGLGVVEIVSGLNPGDEIVSGGAFFLKSELVTSSLSGHAGHGH